MPKTVHDLTEMQLTVLKRRYMSHLEDEGCFYEVLFNQSEKDESDEEIPQDFYDRANEIVPDDVVFEEFANDVFTDADFSSFRFSEN
jgi:hypothetical protein